MVKRVLLIVAVVLTVASASAAQADWRREAREAAFIVNGRCTGQVIGRYVVTASHCVGNEGDPVSLRRMSNLNERLTGVVHRDLPGVDVATVRVDGGLPHRQVEFCPVSARFTPAWAYTFSLGLVGFEATLEWYGRWYQTPPGRWVAVWHGEAYHGASGSAVYRAETGCVQGLITESIFGAPPTTIFGPDASEVLRALE